QNFAHCPLQFDVVDVSGPNEYSVKPLLLVSTLAPLIVVVFRTLPGAAAPPGGVVPEPGRELPHAAAGSAAATTAAAASRPIHRGRLSCRRAVRLRAPRAAGRGRPRRVVWCCIGVLLLRLDQSKRSVAELSRQP